MKIIMKIIGIILLVILAGSGYLVYRNSISDLRENKPYEPDTPAPAPHDGVFTSEHGTMTFNGDNETVVVNFDDTLADLVGIPSGEHKMKYEFLSGDLPPHGSMPIRYDVAHELRFSTEKDSYVVQVGIAAEDGSSATVGRDMVTGERIPLLFRGEKGSFSVIFNK